MALTRCFLLVGAAAVTAACAPGDLAPPTQVLLYVDTDAPLPPAPGETPSVDEHPALFDTLRVDIIGPGALEPCPSCTREFAIDRTTFAAGEASFGVLVEPSKPGYRVRLRLFRTRYRTGGEPSPTGSVDVYLRLPPVPAGLVETRHVLLPTSAVANPIGALDAPIDPLPGPVNQSAVGTWITRTSCAGAPQPGEVCIPGGAYWMGNPQVDRGTLHNYGLEEQLRVNEQRLVVISPFFLDATERRVADFPTSPFAAWSGSDAGTAWDDFFTWSGDPDHAERALNGVLYEEAQSHCKERGRDLPTEAQFEYVASGLRGDDYVWGNTLPECDDAVWGRGGKGIYAIHPFTCNPELELGRPLPPGSALRDRLVLPDGSEVVDLNGNVSEWMADGFAPQESACWPEGVLIDPFCADTTSYPDVRPVRGGAWAFPPVGLNSSLRGAERTNLANPGIGFRCARPDSGS